MTLLGDLGVTCPVVAAPMAGGPTPALVAAVARFGGCGFRAGGHLTTSVPAEQVEL